MTSLIRIFVILGVLMTASSIALTQLLIAGYRENISALDHEITSKDTQISTFWQNENRIEYIGHTILMWLSFSSSQDNHKAAEQLLGTQLRPLLEKHKESFDSVKMSPDIILKLLEKSRAETVTIVDTLYTEKITLEEQQKVLKQKTRFYTNIALLLQALGLLLILSRDIFGRR